jgi:peptide chain release factor 1
MQSFSATLDELERRLHELDHLMADPAVATDADKLMEYGRERSDMEPLVSAWAEHKALDDEMAEARVMADDSDPEMAELAKEELRALRARREELEATIRRLLVPKDPNDEKNVIVEIRAGTGGDEAALFAADLYRMYTRYADKMRWKVDVMSSTPTDGGGFREVIFEVRGQGAYSYLRYESGVNRRGASIPRPPASPCCRRPKRSISRSTTTTSASTSSARPGTAARASTQRTPPSASRTCRPGSSSRCRTRRAS